MKKNSHKVLLPNKEIIFKQDISTVLEFPECLVVLLMNGNSFPDNNVEAWNYDGSRLWNISEIVKLKEPEAYTYITKQDDQHVVVRTFNGVRFVIDIENKTAIEKSITK